MSESDVGASGGGGTAAVGGDYSILAVVRFF
jgi:hypothetical protein